MSRTAISTRRTQAVHVIPSTPKVELIVFGSIPMVRFLTAGFFEAAIMRVAIRRQLMPLREYSKAVLPENQL
jgi:hypothetical protein